MANAMGGHGANSGGEWHQDEMGVGDSHSAGDVSLHQLKCLSYATRHALCLMPSRDTWCLRCYFASPVLA